MRRLGPFLILATLLPAAASAQQVHGRLMDADEGTPVAGATVALEDSAGRLVRQVVSGDLGGFRIWGLEPGTYWLTAERIGYGTVEDQAIRLDSAEVVEIEIRMRPEAVAVEPLSVVARRQVQRGTPDEFYDRMDRLADRGTFVTREEIEGRRVRHPSWAVAMAPGTWIQPSGVDLVSYGRRCSPSIYLNGLPIPDGVSLDEMTSVDRIEGIEIYRGHYVPDTYSVDEGSWGCGVILVWNRTEYDPRWAFSWGRAIVVGALGGLLFGLTALF